MDNFMYFKMGFISQILDETTVLNTTESFLNIAKKLLEFYESESKRHIFQ